MTDKEIARPLELELQELFGEDSYQLERKPCTGKYCGHWDYTLVFGSGRRLYIGLDQRNYLNSLYDHLRAIRHFRAHQEENSRRISAAAAIRNAHRAARFRLTAFSMEKGSPRRMVFSTRRPCQSTTAVQQPENSKNTASTAAKAPACQIQRQLRANTASSRAGSSSGFS